MVAVDTRLFRNPALDAVKGLCIILMVVGHSGAPRGLVEMVSCFHMPAFFIISGFLFKEKYLKDTKSFVSRKLQTIWCPYVLWSVIFILAHNLFYSLHFFVNEYSLQDIGRKLGKAILMRSTENLLGGFWFLTALLFASLVSFLYLKIVGISRWTLLGAIIGSLGVTALIKFRILPTAWYFNAHNFLSLSFFLTGVLLAREHLNEISRRKEVVIAALSCLTIGTFWIKKSILTVDTVMLLPYYLTASMITWGLIVAFWKLPQSTLTAWLVKIGSRTLDILIFHFIAFKCVSMMRYLAGYIPADKVSHFPVPDFPSIEHTTDFHWILYTIAGIAIPLLISLLLDYPRRKCRWL